ncbi:MAG: hypothetical protein QOG67_250 [Verrucomicrobiota bacterium]
MITGPTNSPITDASPLFKARAAGFFWLMTILTSMFAFFVGGRFVVAGDAAATAANVMSHESLYRLAFAANLVATACYLTVTLLVYVLLKPVNRHISLLAAFFSLTGCAIGTVSCLLFLAPVIVLGGGHTVFTVEQLQTQALTFVTLSLQANDIGLVFFGLHVLTVGYLIRRSAFLPRILGALLIVTGVCYLTNSFANFLSLPFKAYLLPFVAAGGLLGEGSLAVWLLVKGVKVPVATGGCDSSVGEGVAFPGKLTASPTGRT